MERKIGAARFKEQCLALLEDLPEEGIVVTKHGRALARVIPYREGSGDLFGVLADKITIHGDLESTGAAWDADG
jgi:hypothetical protein